MTRLVAHVDGGSRGNPGPAAVGVVISTPEGNVVDDHHEFIGEATNNVAEYRAVLAGIAKARELGATELELVGDSELVVRQIKGEYRVKQEGLKPLHAAVGRALRELEDWSIRHVRREHNEGADKLVNQALDAAA